MFHQNLVSLWNKTIMSNYEFDTVAEWLEYWFDVRKRICLLTSTAPVSISFLERNRLEVLLEK